MTHPAFQHQADDFWAIYKRSTCAVERRRSQLLALLAERKSYVEVLAITRYSYQGVDKIVDAYEAQGLDGIKDQRHGNRGAPTLLSDANLLLPAQSIRTDVTEGGVWNRNHVQEWVKTTLQKDLYLGRCYECLDAVGGRVTRQRGVPCGAEGDIALPPRLSTSGLSVPVPLLASGPTVRPTPDDAASGTDERLFEKALRW